MGNRGENSCSCLSSSEARVKRRWIVGSVNTSSGQISAVSTTLDFSDHIGAWRVRWGIGRDDYSVPAGIYAIGSPDAESEVFVTANYKMSFDYLRRSLHGKNGWIVVLETFGINVWCAAGKKTFGTQELIDRIKAVDLAKIVSHRKVILPQLGASGVAARIVTKETGFKIVFGPVRSDDLPAFLNAGMKASDKMRRVQFGFKERLVLAPVELVISAKYILLAVLIVMLGVFLSDKLFSVKAYPAGIMASIALFGGWVAGAFLGPVLLPFLPGRSFALKGIVAGLLVALIFVFFDFTGSISLWEFAAYCLAVPAIASFLTMNFTGASTYTSPSGVRKEMKIYIPLQIVGLLLGVGLWITGLFI